MAILTPTRPRQAAASGVTVKDRIIAVFPLLVLIVLVLLVLTQQPNFLSLASVRGLLESMAPILLLAIGQTFVILTGGIDLSFAVVSSLSTVLLALWLPDMGVGALILVPILACLTGVLTGTVVAFAQIPSFIVSLGAMGLWTGVALTLSSASTIRISAGYDVIGWVTDMRIAGLPVSALLAILLAILISVAIRVLNRGRALHTMGLAENALLMSGNPTRAYRILAFALCGLFSGLAGVVLASSQYSGGPSLGDTLMLPAIAAVVIGGNAITGGVGGPLKTLVGALIIVVLRVGLNAIGIDPAYEQIIYGAVIIGAVVLTIDRSRLGIVK
ncbi:ribose transport system permease protein [Mycetocola sp. BIGb0189]|uniref:ABC transporter permease n=1 Tax=Mycetocola sp. BIGb0189 TaxID=2940604 RepID=UPI0021698E83|nr:ABC transporter permease [Mycetocola sp. BIGb0189]MCS4274956.1 ribose transport system permease protein [Mycetocola sp. BIGb0189]